MSNELILEKVGYRKIFKCRFQSSKHKKTFSFFLWGFFYIWRGGGCYYIKKPIFEKSKIEALFRVVTQAYTSKWWRNLDDVISWEKNRFGGGHDFLLFLIKSYLNKKIR